MSAMTGMTWMEAALVLGVLVLALGGALALEAIRRGPRPRPTRPVLRSEPAEPSAAPTAASGLSPASGRADEGAGAAEKAAAQPREESREPEPGVRLGRRRFFHWLLGLGSLGTFIAMLSAASSLKPLIVQETAKEIGEGDKLVFATGPRKGQLLTREALAEGEGALALPQGKEDVEENLVLVLHLRPDQLEPPTRREWTDQGFVAYSAICTHLGCTVLAELQGGGIFCPCHGGVFDPRRGAIVVSGPPPRPLPQLPIRIDEQGRIVVAGPFTEEVGA